MSHSSTRATFSGDEDLVDIADFGVEVDADADNLPVRTSVTKFWMQKAESILWRLA